MAMTKYELKLKKKEERRIKRLQKRDARRLKRETRKTARIAKRTQRRFERKSEAKYRLWHRIVIKTLRVGGFVSAILYLGYMLYGTFQLESEEMVGKLNLTNAIMILFFGSVAFGFALWFGWKYMKHAIASNAVAANLGQPSLKYSPVVITFVRMVLSSWFLALMWVFSYIGNTYAEALNNGMEHMITAFAIGFGSALMANIVEQRILMRVRNQKLEIESEARMMTKAVYDKMNEEST